LRQCGVGIRYRNTVAAGQLPDQAQIGQLTRFG
jgi:hypothetical protein